MHTIVIWFVDNPSGVAPTVYNVDPATADVAAIAHRVAEIYHCNLPKPINGGTLEIRARGLGWDIIRDGEVREVSIDIHYNTPEITQVPKMPEGF